MEVDFLHFEDHDLNLEEASLEELLVEVHSGSVVLVERNLIAKDLQLHDLVILVVGAGYLRVEPLCQCFAAVGHDSLEAYLFLAAD